MNELLMSLLIVAALPTPFILAVWILRPLDRVARNLRRPVQFSMLDFLGLMFVLQLPMGVIHASIPQEDSRVIWTLDPAAWLISTLVWWTGVSTFCKAGIDDVWQRAVLVFFVLPTAYFGCFAVVVIPGILLGNDPISRGTSVFLIAVELLLISAIYSSGRISRRIAEAATQSAAEPKIDPPADLS